MNPHCIDEWSLQGYDILTHELSKIIDRAILRRVAHFCAITQTITVKVDTFSLPAGHCNRFSAKLDFEPKIGDVIAFGDRPACYTIIDLPYANGINPWMIVLDRPLEEPVRTDFIGFVTQPIRRVVIDDFLRRGTRVAELRLGVEHVFRPRPILDKSLAVAMLS